MTTELRIQTLELLGGHSALDFINTLDWRDRGPEAGGAEECLVSFDALLVWGERAGLLSAAEMTDLTAYGRHHPRRATASVGDAIFLREAIHALFRAAEDGSIPGEGSLATLNRWLTAEHSQLIYQSGQFVWGKGAGQRGPELLLNRIAQAAGELLSSGMSKRIGCCAGPGCGWLYLDTSPNRQRRWCSMQGCGNRAKAQRHYNRSKRRD